MMLIIVVCEITVFVQMLFVLTCICMLFEHRYHQSSSSYLVAIVKMSRGIELLQTALNPTFTLYGHIKTAEQQTIIQQYGNCYTGR